MKCFVKFLLRNIERAIPLLFVVLGVCNLWLVKRLYRSPKIDFSLQRQKVAAAVSNLYEYVHSELRADMADHKRRMLYLSRLHTVGVSNAVAVASNRVDSGSVRAPMYTPLDYRYFLVGRKPMIEYDGWYFGIGDDFGHGPIESISLDCVVCGERVFRRTRHASPTVHTPRQIAARQSGPMRDDTTNEDGQL